jgi:arsenate reductase (thioredoxin)
MSDTLKILFLCSGNSCRSQMAEGWANHLKGDGIVANSAGIAPSGLDRRAVAVMAEKGVDISRQRSKHVNEFKNDRFDWVITVCNSITETCPIFPGHGNRFHFDFDDPPKLAEHTKTDDEKLYHYRRVRDDIRRFVEKIPGILE